MKICSLGFIVEVVKKFRTLRLGYLLVTLAKRRLLQHNELYCPRLISIMLLELLEIHIDFMVGHLEALSWPNEMRVCRRRDLCRNGSHSILDKFVYRSVHLPESSGIVLFGHFGDSEKNGG